MRPGTLLLVSIVLAGALTGEATAGVPDEQASVTVLRGSSAPPPEPAPPSVIVVPQVVYQPVPYPYYTGYVVPSFFGGSFFRHPPVPTFTPKPLPNGWPLLGVHAPMR